MQKRLIKIIFIVGIIMIWILTTSVKATNDGDMESLTSEEEISESLNESALDEDEDLELEDLEEEEEKESSIGSTNEDNNTGVYQDQVTTTGAVTSRTSQPTATYSTIATIPEANLSLNNILNVILIAVGVIIILLAIAILIKLK